MTQFSQTELSLLLVGIGATSVFLRLLALFAFRKSTPVLEILQQYMPMVIIIALLGFLYSRADYSAGAFYGADFIFAGLITVAVRLISKSGILAIVVGTGAFVLMHDYLLKML